MEPTELDLRISNNPTYQKLKAKRSKFGWTLAILMLIVYYGFIGLIAFDKELLFKRIGSGVMTWGMPIGFGVIIFTIIITAIYVRRANSEYDKMTEEIVRSVKK
ncbi:MAG: DUF485 domain-containing protein [Burkholderiales bacterium]